MIFHKYRQAILKFIQLGFNLHSCPENILSDQNRFILADHPGVVLISYVSHQRHFSLNMDEYRYCSMKEVFLSSF